MNIFAVFLVIYILHFIDKSIKISMQYRILSFIIFRRKKLHSKLLFSTRSKLIFNILIRGIAVNFVELISPRRRIETREAIFNFISIAIIGSIVETRAKP